MKLEMRCRREAWRDGIELAIFQQHPTGRIMVADPIIFRELPEGEYLREPMINLQNQEAQFLMDELWRCGLRPSEGTGSAGSLAATERHLHDMQKIAMGLLKQHGV
jgi:hypothetical protein